MPTAKRKGWSGITVGRPPFDGEDGRPVGLALVPIGPLQTDDGMVVAPTAGAGVSRHPSELRRLVGPCYLSFRKGLDHSWNPCHWIS
jgi:hypothetical protein